MRQCDFDKDIYSTIRKNIKKCRDEKRVTSAQLSEMVELSPSPNHLGLRWIKVAIIFTPVVPLLPASLSRHLA